MHGGEVIGFIQEGVRHGGSILIMRIGCNSGSAGIRRWEIQCGDKGLHPSEMRSLPIQAIAFRAETECIESGGDFRRQTMQYPFLGGGFENGITFDASYERMNGTMEVKSAQDFDELFTRVLTSYTVGMRENGIRGQRKASTHENAAIGEREGYELFAGEIIPIESIESEHPEVRRKFAEVNVEDKPHFPKCAETDLRCSGNVKAFEHGEDADPVAVVRGIHQRFRFPIDKNQIDGVNRNSQCRE